MKINLNDTCKVVLTEQGAEHLNCISKKANKHYITKKLNIKLKDDYVANDVYREQLWYIMELFGPSMGLGLPVPFLDCQLELPE